MSKILLNTSLVMLLVVSFATDASAQSRRSRSSGTYTDSTSYTSSTSSGGNTGRMAVSGALGFFGGNAVVTANNTQTGQTLTGLFGLGGDFDYYMAEDLSVGAIFRYYSTADTVGPAEITNSAMTLGGTIKAYVFDTTNWQGSFMGGLGMLSSQIKSGGTSVDSGMGFAFYFGTTLMYKWSSSMQFGIENLRAFAIGSANNGWALNDYMAKVRIAM